MMENKVAEEADKKTIKVLDGLYIRELVDWNIKTIIPIASAVIIICLAAADLFLLNFPETEMTATTKLFKNLIPNLIAALIGVIMLNLFIYRIKRLEKNVEHKELAGEIKPMVQQSVNDSIKEWICVHDLHCPEQVKRIGETVKEFGGDDKPDCYKRFKKFFLAQLTHVNKYAKVEHGFWEMQINDNGKLLDDFDLAYEIIQNQIKGGGQNKKNSIKINASTNLYYIEWWTTTVGLNYLESQKKKDVVRIFFLPEYVCDKIFPEMIKNIYPSYSSQATGEKTMIEIHNILPLSIKQVIYLHAAWVGPTKIKIVSPEMIGLKYPGQANAALRNKIVKEWPFKDVAVITEEIKADSSVIITTKNLFAIVTDCIEDGLSKKWRPLEGKVYFKHDIIQKELIEIVNKIDEAAIPIDSILKDDSLKKEFEDFSLWFDEKKSQGDLGDMSEELHNKIFNNKEAINGTHQI